MPTTRDEFIERQVERGVSQREAELLYEQMEPRLSAPEPEPQTEYQDELDIALGPDPIHGHLREPQMVGGGAHEEPAHRTHEFDYEYPKLAVNRQKLLDLKEEEVLGRGSEVTGKQARKEALEFVDHLEIVKGKPVSQEVIDAHVSGQPGNEAADTAVKAAIRTLYPRLYQVPRRKTDRKERWQGYEAQGVKAGDPFEGVLPAVGRALVAQSPVGAVADFADVDDLESGTRAVSGLLFPVTRMGEAFDAFVEDEDAPKELTEAVKRKVETLKDAPKELPGAQTAQLMYEHSPFAALRDVVKAEGMGEKWLAAHAFALPWARSAVLHSMEPDKLAEASDELALALEPVDLVELSPAAPGMTDEEKAEVMGEGTVIEGLPSPIYVPRVAAETAQFFYDQTFKAGPTGKFASLAEWAGAEEGADLWRRTAAAKRAGRRKESFIPIEDAIEAGAPDDEVLGDVRSLRYRDLPVSARLQRELTGDEVIAAADAEGVTNPTIEAMREAGWGDPMAAVEGVEPDPSILENMFIGEMPVAIQERLYSIDSLRKGVAERKRARAATGGATVDVMSGVLEGLSSDTTPIGEDGFLKAETTFGWLMRVPAGVTQTAVLQADIDAPPVVPLMAWSLAQRVLGVEDTAGAIQDELRFPSLYGVDKMLGSPAISRILGTEDYTRLFSDDSTWGGRLTTHLKEDQQGLALSLPDMAYSLGYGEDTLAFQTALQLGLAFDFLIDWEKIPSAPVGAAWSRGGTGISYARQMSRAAAATKGDVGLAFGAGAAPELFAGRFEARTGTPWDVYGGVVETGVRRNAVRGASFKEQVARDQHDAVREVLRVVTGKSPEELNAMLGEYDETAELNGLAHLDNIRKVMKSNTPRQQALRATPDYQAMRAAAEQAEARGQLPKGGADWAMAVSEMESMRAVIDGKVPRVETYFEQFRLKSVDAPGPEVPKTGVLAEGDDVAKFVPEPPKVARARARFEQAALRAGMHEGEIIAALNNPKPDEVRTALRGVSPELVTLWDEWRTQMGGAHVWHPAVVGSRVRVEPSADGGRPMREFEGEVVEVYEPGSTRHEAGYRLKVQAGNARMMVRAKDIVEVEPPAAAPATPGPAWFSRLEEGAVEAFPASGSMRAKGVVTKLKALAKKDPALAEELKWMDLSEIEELGRKKMTVDEFRAFMRGQRVEVREVQKRSVEGVALEDGAMRAERNALEWAVGRADLSLGDLHALVAFLREEPDGGLLAERLDDLGVEGPNREPLENAAIDYIAAYSDRGSEDPTRWSEYTQPGAENYREVLLTLPDSVSSSGWVATEVDGRPGTWDVMDASGTRVARFNSPTAEAAISRAHQYELEAPERRRGRVYDSAHWSEPNVLAHIRLSDRTTADGKRVLFVEEAQSDWHQAARKHGYVEDTPDARMREQEVAGLHASMEALRADLKDAEATNAPDARKMALTDEILAAAGEAERLRSALNARVPDAPFKEKRWARLALRRVVRMAAEEGYDGVAVVRGEDIQRVVGGGLEGQKRFYDVNVPRYLADIGKPWGVRPGDTTIGGTAGSVDRMGEALGWGVWERDGGSAPVEMFGTADEARAFVARQGDPERFTAGEFGDLETHDVPGALSATILDITPDMRRAVVERGLPLFQDDAGRAAGAVATEPGLTPGPMWYSRLEEGTLEEFPASGKLRAKAIATKMRALAKKDPALADELEWVDLAELESKGRQKLSVDEYREWMRSQRLEVKDVTKVAGPDMFARPETQAAMAQLRTAVEDAGGGPGLFHELQSALRPGDHPFGTMEGDNPRVGHIINDIADGDPMHVERISEAYDDVVDSLVYEGPDEADAARWAEYQQPGGERYREILLTLPVPLAKLPPGHRVVERGPGDWAVLDGGGAFFAGGETRAGAVAYAHRVAAEKAGGARGERGFRSQNTYTSPHWDEANVVAHIRLTERISPDGERLLFIEEIQSDWHQAGRKKGYQLPRSEIDKLEARSLDLRRRMRRARAEGDEADLARAERELAEVSPLLARNTEDAYGVVPDAPFKDKRWARLALRRVVRMAAEQGYDGVAVVRGEDIQRVVGGGLEGQKRFYDVNVPRYLADIGKPWGVKPERKGGIYSPSLDPHDSPYSAVDAQEPGGPADAPERWVVEDEHGARFGGVRAGRAEAERVAAQLNDERKPPSTYLPITPDMRRSVVERGLPLFQEGADGARGSLETSGPLAPTFYSAVDNAIDRVFAKGAKSIKAESFLAMVRKQPDVKAEEIDFLGLEEWAKGQGRVTREAAKAHVAAHALEVRDVLKGGKDPKVEAQASEVERLNQQRGQMMQRAPLIEFREGPQEVAGTLRGDLQGRLFFHDAKPARGFGEPDAWTVRELKDMRMHVTTLGPERMAQVQEALEWSREYQALNNEHGMAMRHLQELERESVDDPTRYKDWSHDGGRGYQELLLTMALDESDLPPGVEVRERVSHGTRHFVVIEDGERISSGETPEGAVRAYFDQKGGVFTYDHWDERNVLAHIRFDTRIDALGRRILFIHEVQSDWHQQGLKRGYLDKGAETGPTRALLKKRLSDVQTELSTARNAFLDKELEARGLTRDQYRGRTLYQNADIMDALAEYNDSPEMQRMHEAEGLARREYENRLIGWDEKGRVPDAPLKTSWHALAMKRMVRLAADGDYDAIAWPTGVMEAELFDLGGHVDVLRWEFDDPADVEDGRLVAIKDGEEVDLPEDFGWDDLEEAIGDEPARLLKEDAKATAARWRHDESELITVHELTETDIEAWDLEGAAVPGQHVLLGYYGEPHDGVYGDITVFDDPVEADKARRDNIVWGRLDAEMKMGEISAGELKIGTKGMEAFYDGKLVGWAKKFGKKMGARVGMAELPDHPDSPNVHMMTLSPKMKRLARFKGQPLFQEKGGRAAGSIKVSKAKVALERLRRTPFVPTRMIVEMLGDRPEYLDGVIEFLAEQRQRLAAGKLTNRDVAKAYFMTVASMGSDAVRASLVEGRAGFRIPEDFVTYNKKGDRMVRPEEAAAAWLFTDDGQRALNAIERGEFDADAWGKGADVRLTYGDDRVRNSSSLNEPKVKERQVTMQNLQEATDAINRAGTDADALFKAAQRLAGIGEAKKAFIGHLLGMGSRATADAVEINVWLTGRGDIGRLKGKRAEVARLVKDTSSKRVARELSRRVNQSIRGLKRRGIGTDIPSEMFGHVVHHWIWDKAKGVETTHKGMYKAQRLAQKSEKTGRAKGSITIEQADDIMASDAEDGHFAMAAASGHVVEPPPDWKDVRFKRDLDSLTAPEQAAWDRVMAQRDDRARVEAQLKLHKGTPWAHQAIEGAMVRASIMDAVAGRESSVVSALDYSVTAKRLIQGASRDGVWAYFNSTGKFLSGAEKPVNNVNGSFLDCNPSKACATYCYATDGNYRYFGSVVKAELVTAAIEDDPIRAANQIAAEYRATSEFREGKALRLFDKGDLSKAWLPVIEELNSQDVRVQVFSKRPENLREVSDRNVRLLSIDDGRVGAADANPDLATAVVYRGEEDIPLIQTLLERDQIGVILPVKASLAFKAQAAAKRAVRALREQVPAAKKRICPIDSGVLRLGVATTITRPVMERLVELVEAHGETSGLHRFRREYGGSPKKDKPKKGLLKVRADERDLRKVRSALARGEDSVVLDRTFNCTKCDARGGLGCFLGKSTERVMQSSDVTGRTPRRYADRVQQLRERLRAELARGVEGEGDLGPDGHPVPGRVHGFLQEVDALFGELLGGRGGVRRGRGRDGDGAGADGGLAGGERGARPGVDEEPLFQRGAPAEELESNPLDVTPDTVGPLRRGMSLEGAESALRDNAADVEHAAVFDAEGRQVGRFTNMADDSFWGGLDKADTEKMEWALSNMGLTRGEARLGSLVHVPEWTRKAAMEAGDFVFTHYHPSGAPLSLQDLQVTFTMNLREMRAVTSEGVYVLARPEGAAEWQFLTRAEGVDRSLREAHWAASRRASEQMDAQIRAAGGAPGSTTAKGYSDADFNRFYSDALLKGYNDALRTLGSDARLEFRPHSAAERRAGVAERGPAADVPGARGAGGVDEPLAQRGWAPTRPPLVARNYVSPRDKVRMSAADKQTRDVAYALKRGDPEAVATAADELAQRVPQGAVLVPAPDSRGNTAGNLALAEAIAERVGGEVRDVLSRAAPVESSRAMRERGRVRRPAEHGIEASEQLPDAFIVDNVIATGGTMRAAQDAMGGGTPLAWADRSQRWGREQMLMQRADPVDTPEFKAWFGDSKVVDEQGKPLVVYHGTRRGFDVFNTEGLGAHFGTASAANARVGLPLEEGAAIERAALDDDLGDVAGSLVPVYLSVKSPFRMPDRLSWLPDMVLADIEKAGALEPRILRQLREDPDIEALLRGELVGDPPTVLRAQEAIKEALEDAGYDGIVYRNRVEGEPADSYAVFRPEQIKSATGNRGTFDPADPSILRQRAEAGEGLTVAQAEDAILEQFPFAGPLLDGRLRVVESFDDIDGGRWSDLDDGSQTAMWVPDGEGGPGTAYILAPRMTPELLQSAVVHEVGAHMGMRGLLGSEEARLLDRAAELARSATDGPAARAHTKAMADLEARGVDPESARGRELYRREALAYLVEVDPQNGIVRDLIARLKAWLFRQGLKLTLNEADLRAMAIAALRNEARVAAGEPVPIGGGLAVGPAPVTYGLHDVVPLPKPRRRAHIDDIPDVSRPRAERTWSEITTEDAAPSDTMPMFQREGAREAEWEVEEFDFWGEPRYRLVDRAGIFEDYMGEADLAEGFRYEHEAQHALDSGLVASGEYRDMRTGRVERGPLFQRGDGEAAAGSVEVASPGRAPTATLFSGGGLVEEGLRGAIKPIYAVEFDENVAAHYAVVHGDHVRVGRVQNQDFTEASDADYLHASPVCKTSSLAKLGRNEAPLDVETARSTAEALRTIRPPVFTLENVAAYGKTEAMRVITDELDKLGYKWDTHVYEAADYGAPTRRKRLLLRAVGPDQGELPPRPEPTHGPGADQPHAGWFDAVSDLVDDLPDQPLGDWQRKRLERHGIDVDNITEPLLVMGGSTNRKTLPHAFGGEPAPTIKATPRELHRIVMPDGRVKRVTPRVMARMTGLPDSYPLPGSRIVATTIIGNGVPPALSRAVFEPLLEPMMAEGPVPSRRMSDADVVAAIERVQGDKYTAPRREAPRRARGMLGGSSAGLTPAARAEVDALRERQDIIENRLAEAEEAGRHPDEDLLAESAAIQEQLAGYEDHFAEQDDIGRWQESGGMDVRIARTVANRPKIESAEALIARQQAQRGHTSPTQTMVMLGRQLDKHIDNALRPDARRYSPRDVEVRAARVAEDALVEEYGPDWREIVATPRSLRDVRRIFEIQKRFWDDVELGDWREGLRMAVEHYYRSATDDLTRAQRPKRRLSDAEVEDIAKDIAGAEGARRGRIKSRGVRPGEPARVERRLDLLRLAKVPEARLRRLGWTDEQLPGDIAGGEPLYQPGDGGARGTFDTTTAVITLYQGSTLRTLWHEKGHLIDLVTGTPEVRQAMDAAFERMPEAEVRALAAEAHRVGPKQAADARGLDKADAINAQIYVQDGESGPMRTVEGREQMARMFEVWLERRTAPNGWLRMQFQQLQQGLADVWAQVRGRDLEVDPAVAAVWDRWLRPERIADSVAVEIGAAEGLARFPHAVVPEVGPLDDAVGRAGRAREAGRVNLRREEVLQDMGIRAGEEVPLHDLVAKAIRYVATEQARRNARGIELVAMTARTVVPAGRAEGLQREVHASLSTAIGMSVMELVDEGRAADDAVSLDRAQQAGLRTLANRVANNPVVDPRGFEKLINPRSDLSTVSFQELNALQEAQIDVMAGPGARRDLRAERIPPTLGVALARALWEIPDKLHTGTGSVRTQNWKRRLSDMFTTSRPGDKYVDPHVTEAWDRATREVGRSQDWVRTAGRNIREGDPQSGLVDTLKGVMRQLTTPVSIANVQVLGRMRDRFNGRDEVSNVRALRGVRDEVATTDPLRIDRLLDPDHLSMLQGVIDDVPHGATPEEAAAMQLLHFHAGGITQAPPTPAPAPAPAAGPTGPRMGRREAMIQSGIDELLRERTGTNPRSSLGADQIHIVRAIDRLLRERPNDPRVLEYQRLISGRQAAPSAGRRPSMRSAIEQSGLAELLRPRLGYDPLAGRALDQGPILRAVNQLISDMPHDPRVREYQRLKGLQQADPLPPPPPDNLLTPDEITAVEAALAEISEALDRRWGLVSERAADIAAALTGTAGMEISGSGSTARASSILTLTDRSKLELYEAFFTGRWAESDLPPDLPNAKRPVTLESWTELRGHKSGADPRTVSRVDPNVIRTEILVRMRALEVLGEFSETLARMGMPTSKADVAPAGAKDRGAFMDDVIQYLNAEMSWSLTHAVDPEGLTVHYPEVGKISPVEEGLTRQHYPETIKQDAQVHNIEAYTEAQRLLARFGYKRGKGGWERVTLPDGSETIMPSMLREPLDQALEQAADVGRAFDSVAAPRVRSVLPVARQVADPATRRAMDPTKPMGERVADRLKRLRPSGRADDISRPWSIHAAMTIGETIDSMLGMFPMIFTKIRMGLTVGPLIPNPPYFTANAIGALLQAYMGRGARGAAAALGRHPKVTAAVVKRLWGNYDSYPGGGVIVTPDGRVYTADMIADMAKSEGLSSSYIQSEATPSLLDDLRDMHRGAYERYANIPFMAGRWQQFLMDSATGIDNWMRVGTFIDELKLGKSPAEAAKVARLVGFDYSKLSTFEKAIARNVIMFYSFLKLNQELMWHTLLRNPYRVLGQLRALKGLTREQLEEDPVLVLQEWNEGRLAVFYEDANAANEVAQRHVSIARIDGFLYLAPPLPINDGLSLWANIWDAAKGDEKALGETVSRAAPWIQAPFVMTTNRDIFYGRDLEAYNDVPPWFVETDRAWTGGALVDGLMRLDPPMAEADSARRWTAENHDVYRITDKTGAKWWWAAKNLGAFAPGFGRSMQTVTALDRSFEDYGPVEALVQSSRVARNHWADQELVAPIAMGEGDTAHPRAGLTVGSERLGLLGIRPVQIFTRGEVLDRMTAEKLAEQTETISQIDQSLNR